MNIKKIRRVVLDKNQAIRVAVASPKNELFVDLHSCAKAFYIPENEDYEVRIRQLYCLYVDEQKKLLIEKIDGNSYISLYTFIDILTGQNRELVIQTLVSAIAKLVLDKKELHYHG